MAIVNYIAALLFVFTNGPTRSVSADEIRQLVDRFVYTKLDSAKNAVTIEYRSLPTRVLNVSERAQLRVVSDPTVVLRNGVMLPVEVYYGNHVEHTFIVSLRIRTYGSVVRASDNIEKGESGQRITVIDEMVETTTLPDDFIADSQNLVGKRTKRMLRKNAVLVESMFESIPLINQGDAITLLVRNNNVVIKARAVAREDGASGDVVMVEKVGSRERLKARVLDKFTVELIAQK